MNQDEIRLVNLTGTAQNSGLLRNPLCLARHVVAAVDKMA